MHDVNMGATIARHRRTAGLTQDALASHLGVSKAAVSKWEVGQSLPDVALLPRIAAYFNLTLDELFDYRPQLEESEILAERACLMELFSRDVSAAYDRMDSLVRDYCSCWPLLLHMASLYLWRAAVEPGRANVLAQRACDLLERVEQHVQDVDEVLGAKIMRASALSVLGRLDDAVSLMESLRPKQPALLDNLLAGLYQQKGDVDSCMRVHQEALFWGSQNALDSVVSQLLLAGACRLRVQALLRAGEGLVEGFDYRRYNPATAVMFWGNAALACARTGDAHAARAYLARFVEGVDAVDDAALACGAHPVLYDHVPNLAAPDASLQEGAQAWFPEVGLAAHLKDQVACDGVWEGYADDFELNALLDRLGAR